MVIKFQRRAVITVTLVYFLLSDNAFAHDPIFSPGPHVLFKDGVEIHAEFSKEKKAESREDERAIAVKYGITGDWVIGAELPYQISEEENITESGVGDVVLSSKYRFWREDSLGEQSSVAFITQVKLDSGNERIGSGTTDTMLGFAYGYESLKWYRWASMRYRFNQDSSIPSSQFELERGDRWFVDLAGGYRFQVNDYLEADTVWLLELNGEFAERSDIGDLTFADSGGSRWFVSPGVMWTLRNFAFKAGVQIPVRNNLNGDQTATDYRARIEFEWHL